MARFDGLRRFFGMETADQKLHDAKVNEIRAAIGPEQMAQLLNAGGRGVSHLLAVADRTGVNALILIANTLTTMDYVGRQAERERRTATPRPPAATPAGGLRPEFSCEWAPSGAVTPDEMARHTKACAETPTFVMDASPLGRIPSEVVRALIGAGSDLHAAFALTLPPSEIQRRRWHWAEMVARARGLFPPSPRAAARDEASS